MNCRHCNTPLTLSVLDLVSSPPSNSYLLNSSLSLPEMFFPLRVLVCSNCWLVQTEDFTNADQLFTHDYAYYSSTSSTWIQHCKNFVEDVCERFDINKNSLICEIAANDGYLLQFFQNRSIPCYGVEPSLGTAEVARSKGIEILCEFFNEKLGRKLSGEKRAVDFSIANNVLAHVPNINDFVSGFREILKPNGIATFEFPHLFQLIECSQFDTVYHEHFSYLSLGTTKRIFEAHGLMIFDVDEIPTHGGSLRVFAQRSDTGKRAVNKRVNDLLSRESDANMFSYDYYKLLQKNANRIKNAFLKFLIDSKEKGKKVGAYGAAAKGNTLINFAGVKSDLLPFVVDLSPGKQGRFLPGSHIPIVTEEKLREEQPDYILILPWNLQNEIKSKLDYCREWGAHFVVAVPKLEFI